MKKAVLAFWAVLYFNFQPGTLNCWAQQTGSFVKPFIFSSAVYPNQSRTMAYYVPANYNPTKKYKLFISMGGQGWTPAADLISPYGPSNPGTVDMLNSTACAATIGDFIAVSPSISPQAVAAGAPDGTWPYPDDADDGLPEAIINEVKASYNIDETKVYLTGFSLGARGALYLGLKSYAKLRGLILFTPAVQGQNEAKNLNYYQNAANPYCHYDYNNAVNIPIALMVGANDPNGAGCSFCTPADPVKSYATVIVPEVKNQIIAAGAGNKLQYNSIAGVTHKRPSASYMCSAYTFIEGFYTTGIEGAEEKEGVVVFPNPSQGIFSVAALDKPAEIKVYNTTGQPVHHELLPGPNTLINLSSRSDGLYFIEVRSGDVIFSEKVVISRE